MTCNQCAMRFSGINGVACHDRGCPNSRSLHDLNNGWRVHVQNLLVVLLVILVIWAMGPVNVIGN